MKNGKSKAVEEVERLEALLQQADTVTDPDFHETYLAPDILFTDPQGRCLPKGDLVAANRPAGQLKYSSFDVTEREYSEHGTTVLVRCRVDIGVNDFIMPLRFSRVWGKRTAGSEDRWQILLCQITPIIQ